MNDTPRLADVTRLNATSMEPEARKVYAVGTLRYSLAGLTVVFVWLLWGDFAFTFFESIFSRFLPLYAKDLQASNALIGVMTGSFAGLVNIFFLPSISQWSDRYRGSLGRRIPFLYAVTPLTVFSLVAIGFVPEIAGWLHAHVIARLAPSIAIVAVTLPVLCVFVVSFHFFNMVLVNAYNWLLRDVVPLEQMGRFLSWFRIISTVSTFAFLRYVFPYVVSERRTVFLSVGGFYLISFLLMCLNVKEGQYPPPPPADTRPKLIKSFALYFRDCLSLPIYRNYFIASVLSMSATACAGPFSILFTRETLGLDMDDMGKIYSWGAVASALIYFPVGWLCDRFTPLRVAITSLLALMTLSILAFFLVHGKTSYLIYTLVYAVPAIGWALGTATTMMTLFPNERFGEFSSGLNVFGCGAQILGNYLMGMFMDLVHSNYRATFLWSAILFALALHPLILTYRAWIKNGGPSQYLPPTPPGGLASNPHNLMGA